MSAVLSFLLPGDLAENYNIQIDIAKLPCILNDGDEVLVNGARYSIWSIAVQPPTVYLSLMPVRQHTITATATMEYVNEAAWEELFRKDHP
jgi:hypothetical protein